MVNVPERKWWWSDDVYGQPEHQRTDHGIAEVETDAGLTGLTQIQCNAPMARFETALQSWLGLDVLSVNLADPRRYLVRAHEQAILDLRGQALGVPIWQLLGGRLRDRIPVTQCTGYKTPQHTADDARWGWEHGFRAYKMKCITPDETTPEQRIRYVTDRVEAIHKAAPEMIVRPDIRRRLDGVWAAVELARRIEGCSVECLESPITSGAAAGTYSEYSRLRQLITLPIADHIRGTDLLTSFQANGLDYAITGGIGHLDQLRQSQLAHELGMGGWGQEKYGYGPRAAMALHVAACMRHLTQAYDIIGPVAWEDSLVNEPFDLEDGCYPVPDRPGLGFTLNHDAVKKYLLTERTFE